MFTRKIDLVKELEKERQKDSQYNLSKLEQMQADYNLAAGVLYENPSHTELLAKAGFLKGLQREQAVIDDYRKQEIAALNDAGIEKEGIFHKKQIQEIASRYKLCFHYSTDVVILPPKEAVNKIALLKEKFGNLLEDDKGEGAKSKLLILCPGEAAYEQTSKQCLLFYRLSEDFYYFAAEWGEPMKADLVDRIKYTYGVNLIRFFKISCLVLAGLCIFSLLGGLLLVVPALTVLVYSIQIMACLYLAAALFGR